MPRTRKNADKTGNADKSGGVFGEGLAGLASKLVDMLGLAGLLVAETKSMLRHRAETAVWRGILLLTLSVWMSVGLLFILLGGQELLIDSLGLPRGWVHAGSGLVLFLACLAAFYAVRQRPRGGHR